eukprot:scaffold7416_cov390-Prasinococcus_capsulatus_cf.AAC.1
MRRGGERREVRRSPAALGPALSELRPWRPLAETLHSRPDGRGVACSRSRSAAARWGPPPPAWRADMGWAPLTAGVSLLHPPGTFAAGRRRDLPT